MEKINYTLIRSHRKTIGISVSLKEGVKVSAPRSISLKQIEDIVEKKSAWISKKLRELEQIQSQKPSVNIPQRGTLSYLGKLYPLKILDKDPSQGSKTITVASDGKGFLVYCPKDLCEEKKHKELREALIKWYKKVGESVLVEVVRQFSDKMGVVPSKVLIKDQKTRWGSCTGKNVLNFNWRILLAPLPIVEYLVVHELAHIIERNHSKAYWQVVERHLPDYKERSLWLKENGASLDI